MSSLNSHTRRAAQRHRDNKRIASLVAQQVAKVIPQIVSEIHAVSSQSSVDSKAENPKPRFSFKNFKACAPLAFTGNDGPTTLFHWFDAMEVAFKQSGCPLELRTVNATGVFQSRALDWWTAERNKRGTDEAYDMPWDELKQIMIKEYCPPHEKRKLENEFWGIKQDGPLNAAYTSRFKILSVICPGQVPTEQVYLGEIGPIDAYGFISVPLCMFMVLC